MPPKKKYTKQQIVDAAFNIAKEQGISSITIRKVADSMGSSIAPIYVNFAHVDELIQEVIAKTVEISKQFMYEQKTGEPFLDIGVASLRFAQKYSVLFRELVLHPNPYVKQYQTNMEPELIEYMQQEPELANFTEEELKTILFKMKAFQIGLSVMIANRMLEEELSEEAMIDLLSEMGEDVVYSMKARKSGELNKNG